MKTLGKKLKTKIIDLAFVHSEQSPNLAAIEEKPRDLGSLEAMMKDLLRLKYRVAEEKTAELQRAFGDREEADFNFHPEAGNSLSLTFGTAVRTQPTTTLSWFSGTNSPAPQTRL
jgi:hypothetical protein